MSDNGLDAGDSLKLTDKFRFLRGYKTDVSKGERWVENQKLVDLLNDPTVLTNVGGFDNPMTTAGDIIVGGVDGAPARLAIGTALQVLRVNAGATALEYAASGGGITWSTITTNTTAAKNNGYFIDTTSGTVALTFPATPAVGDTFAFYLKNTTNTCSLNRNGQPVNGAALVIGPVLNTLYNMVYVDETRGWVEDANQTFTFADIVFTATTAAYPVPDGATSVDILVVAGGGGGAYGGGGGGGVRNLTGIAVSDTDTLDITIGAGGAGATGGASIVEGTDGGNTTVALTGGATLASVTGGGGGGGAGTAGFVNINGRAGGSGGGAGQTIAANGNGGAGNAGTYNPVEGFAGATSTSFAAPNASCGGGGASEAGSATTVSNTIGGDGGDGVTIYGYAVGGGGGGCGGISSGTAGGAGGLGGGGAGRVALSGIDGTANTGGGGGGGGFSTSYQAGGAGGSGFVVLRFA
jgi:hypothetical protein